MKFGGIGVPELLIILAVVLLIFGPKNLPKLGSAIGRTVKNLREGMDGKKKDEEKSAAPAETAEEAVEPEAVETVEAAAAEEKKAEA